MTSAGADANGVVSEETKQLVAEFAFPSYCQEKQRKQQML